MMKLNKILATIVTTAAISTTAVAGDIKLTIKNIKNDQGHVVVRAFHESMAEGFPTGQSFREERIKAQAGEIVFELKSVPNGKWAIGVYHDLDDSGDLKTNFIGAPQEPVANTGEKVFLKPKFGPSSFDVSDAALADVSAEF
jgi:uncharacterized protein (DUF2141 family)